MFRMVGWKLRVNLTKSGTQRRHRLGVGEGRMICWVEEPGGILKDMSSRQLLWAVSSARPCPHSHINLHNHPICEAEGGQGTA